MFSYLIFKRLNELIYVTTTPFPMHLFWFFISFLQISFTQIPPTRGPEIRREFETPATTKYPPLDNESKDQTVVKTSQGRIVGKRITLKKLPWTPDKDFREDIPHDRGPFDPNPVHKENDVDIFVFLGIPYAEKPTDARRFKPPQKLNRFPGDEALHRAFHFGPACAQDPEQIPRLAYSSSSPLTRQPYEWSVDEDCLYLNIFTPQVSTHSNLRYPVFVFFHGGNFQTGSGNDWPGHVLASKGLVVVTANYRLGPFGFLSLGSSDTGNYGLLDQRLVLEWVQDHISAFNGDPGRVTLAGHGSGAASAGLHMLSPGSANLFHTVAAMSGAEVSYHQHITKPALAFNNTLKLGHRVGCTGTQKATDVWDCLLTRSSNDIIQAADSILVEFNRFAFLPTMDGSVLPNRSPEDLLRAAQVVSSVPYLTGINRNDGTEVLLSERDLARFKFQIDRPFLEHKVLDYVLKRNYTMNRRALVEAIEYQYTFWPDTRNDDQVRRQFLEFSSDAYYAAPVSLSALLHSQSGFVYMYLNNYTIQGKPLNPQKEFLLDWMGVCHDCDLYLLFGFPWMPTELLPANSHLKEVRWTENDRNSSEVFMAYWREFAKNKNPSLPSNPPWPNFALKDHWYMEFINYTSQKIRRDYRWEKTSFWNYFIDELADIFTTTYSPILASYRKQATLFKITTGAFVVLFFLLVIVAGTFAYLLFEKKRRGSDDAPLVPIRSYDTSRQNFAYDIPTPPPPQRPAPLEPDWTRTPTTRYEAKHNRGAVVPPYSESQRHNKSSPNKNPRSQEPRFTVI